MKPYEPIVCYSIGAMTSEGMLSDNPTAGIHETTVARTIDASGSNPACWQGGDLIIQVRKDNEGVCDRQADD